MAKKAGSDEKGRKRTIRPYPACEFSKALEIGQGIMAHAGGEKVRRMTLMEKMELNPNSGTTRQKITDSGKYKITTGSYASDHLELTDLGRIVADNTSSERDRREAQFKLAIRDIAPFKILYEAFEEKRVPAKEVLVDKLEESKTEATDLSECVDIFLKNATFLGLIRDVGGTKILGSIEGVLEGLPRSVAGGDGGRLNGSAEAHAVTIGSPVEGSDGRVCFVIMPFVERDEDHPDGFFSEVLEQIFTPAATAAGFTVRTAERRGSDVIQHTIVNELLAADLVLADLTEHNPNVLFELGLRMHADLPVALVKSNLTRRIFDVDNMIRVEEYDPRLWSSTVRDDVRRVQEHIEAVWANRDSGQSYMKILRGESRVASA